MVDILERELLGPLNGPDEILDASPDAVYLIGRIAPVRLSRSKDTPREEGSDDAPTDVGDDADADEDRGVPVTAVDDSAAAAEEDTAEDEPQKRGLIIPSSMGLRFQIPDSLDEFTITASWGTYHPDQGRRPRPVPVAPLPARPGRDHQHDPGRRPRRGQTTTYPLRTRCCCGSTATTIPSMRAG